VADQKLKSDDKEAHTLVIGLRSRLFAPLRNRMRGGG
jgi:hypothetical protein